MEPEVKKKINNLSLIVAIVLIFVQVIILFSGVFGEHSLIRYQTDLACKTLDKSVYTSYAAVGEGANFEFRTPKHPLCPIINISMFLINPGWNPFNYLITYIISFFLYFFIIKGILILKYKLPRKYFLTLSIIVIILLSVAIITFWNYNPCWNLSGQDKQDCLNAFTYATVFNEKSYCLQKVGEETYCKGTEPTPIDKPEICLEKYSSLFKQKRCFMQIASDCNCWLRPGTSHMVLKGYIDSENHECCDNLREVSPFDLIIGFPEEYAERMDIRVLREKVETYKRGIVEGSYIPFEYEISGYVPQDFTRNAMGKGKETPIFNNFEYLGKMATRKIEYIIKEDNNQNIVFEYAVHNTYDGEDMNQLSGTGWSTIILPLNQEVELIGAIDPISHIYILLTEKNNDKITLFLRNFKAPS